VIGYEAFEAGGLAWRMLHGAIVPLTPPHRLDGVEAAAMRRMVHVRGAFLARWESGFDSQRATEWWHVVKDGDPGLSLLSKKTRYLVRQGIANFDARPCTRADIAGSGYSTYHAAFERYHTFERRFGEPEFRAAVEAMPDCVEFWGVFDRVSGGMAAFAENVVDADSCFYSTMWFVPEALKRSASYALVQAMNEHYLGERRLRYVSDGARSISHETNVHAFLQDKFGFRRAYCTLHVAYSRKVGLAVALAYPFRRLLKAMRISSRLDVLLEQERIRRACLGCGA
jgi:hypothetical protein